MPPDPTPFSTEGPGSLVVLRWGAQPLQAPLPSGFRASVLGQGAFEVLVAEHDSKGSSRLWVATPGRDARGERILGPRELFTDQPFRDEPPAGLTISPARFEWERRLEPRGSDSYELRVYLADRLVLDAWWKPRGPRWLKLARTKNEPNPEGGSARLEVRELGFATGVVATLEEPALGLGAARATLVMSAR